MKITITTKAKSYIKQVTPPNKIPGIDMIKAGCAGNMLVMKLLPRDKLATIINIDEIEIGITGNVKNIEDILIDIKTGLTEEIVVTNNSATQKCRCGKSFRV